MYKNIPKISFQSHVGKSAAKWNWEKPLILSYVSYSHVTNIAHYCINSPRI